MPAPVDQQRPDHSAWLHQARATWDERAPWWDEVAQVYAAAPDRVGDIHRTATALNLQPGSRLLDAGCGTGQFAIAFARRGCDVTAVDLAPDMLKRARRHAQEAGVEIIWREGDLTALPDRDETYDAVHARLSLHFVPDMAATLTELRRVLRPGGRLYASIPGALSPIYANVWQRHLDPGRRANNYATPWELACLLEHQGWAIVDQWGDFGPTPDGAPNSLRGEAIPTLDIRLQQAAATTWAFIAE
ncbi:MAG TPA: class I SAM-dependent methyltransferase [Thermomicrobiales bacterium]|nr:class I SAM-dependent methyltransferase [Thermomicrobiales bacterium]